MGNCFAKNTKSKYHDFPESIDLEHESMKLYTKYINLTDDEKLNIDKIEECKKILNYEYLVFSGGSMKGLAYCGALEILEQLKILKYIRGFAGSSAGAVVAILLAIGYTATETRNIIYNTDFDALLGVHSTFGHVEDMVKLSHNLGCSTGDEFEGFIENLIERKIGNKNFTFGDLHSVLGKDLVVTGTDINRELTIYFSHRNHPHMPLKEAARISMSIPIVFVPVEHNGDMFVDGGVLDNYPIHVFDGSFPGDLQAINNLIPINPKVLGFRLIADDQSETMEVVNYQKITGIKQYIFRLIDTMYTSNERRFMRPSFWKRSVSIHVPNIPIYQFRLSRKEKDRLIRNGRIYTQKYFKLAEDPFELDKDAAIIFGH